MVYEAFRFSNCFSRRERCRLTEPTEHNTTRSKRNVVMTVNNKGETKKKNEEKKEREREGGIEAL